jgi:diguanylate cyclase (GGDEF)-like protein
MEQQLALRAFYDPLTGLPNRLFFMECLARAFANLRRKPSAVLAILFLDLDRLKPVNDAQGHAAGDQLLVEFSRRLKGCIRPHDIAARMGGDEFTVLLEDVRSEQEATEVAVRILESLKDPFRLESGEVSTTVSIGIAFSDCGAAGPDDLLKAADAAMYRAKTSGKARYEIHRKEAPDLRGNP